MKPLSKHPVKCTQAGKPRAQRGIGYSFFRVLQKTQGGVQAQFVHVSVEVCVEGLRKDPGESERAVWFNLLVIGSAQKKMITGKESVRAAGMVISYMVMGDKMTKAEKENVREIIGNARNNEDFTLPEIIR